MPEARGCCLRGFGCFCHPRFSGFVKSLEEYEFFSCFYRTGCATFCQPAKTCGDKKSATEKFRRGPGDGRGPSGRRRDSALGMLVVYIKGKKISRWREGPWRLLNRAGGREEHPGDVKRVGCFYPLRAGRVTRNAPRFAGPGNLPAFPRDGSPPRAKRGRNRGFGRV
jgi:hypothetical protein